MHAPNQQCHKYDKYNNKQPSLPLKNGKGRAVILYISQMQDPIPKGNKTAVWNMFDHKSTC